MNVNNCLFPSLPRRGFDTAAREKTIIEFRPTGSRAGAARVRRAGRRQYFISRPRSFAEGPRPRRRQWRGLAPFRSYPGPTRNPSNARGEISVLRAASFRRGDRGVPGPLTLARRSVRRSFRDRRPLSRRFRPPSSDMSPVLCFVRGVPLRSGAGRLDRKGASPVTPTAATGAREHYENAMTRSNPAGRRLGYSSRVTPS